MAGKNNGGDILKIVGALATAALAILSAKDSVSDSAKSISDATSNMSKKK